MKIFCLPKSLTMLLVSFLGFSSCDCAQEASGIVLDEETKLPLGSVSVGKFKVKDNNFPSTYTNNQGRFAYTSISDGFRKCPDLVLYFEKVGYESLRMTFESFSENDTVYLKKVKPVINLDSLNKTNNQNISPLEQDLTKAIVYLQDSTINLVANIRKDHRFFGYERPDIQSKRLVLFSIFTDDVEGNPFNCKLGSYYDMSSMESMTIKYLGTIGNFVKAIVTDKSGQLTFVFFEKRWVNFDK